MLCLLLIMYVCMYMLCVPLKENHLYVGPCLPFKNRLIVFYFLKPLYWRQLFKYVK